ncbi:hypothetical protein GX441_01600 [bacterium]|nr:hypothetical protein [bacterium]
MNQDELIKYMSFNKEGQKHVPLFSSFVNDKFIVAAYQGGFRPGLSPYDILIKYRQKDKGKWSRIRTPKHIHWAVDILLKMHSDKQKTQEFLDFLIHIWNNTKGFKNEEDRKRLLSIEILLGANKEEIDKYDDLGKKGEYSIKFLILIAKLLMMQEKTNLETAYMFKKLLTALREGEDIFNIVSIATHNRGTA